MLNDFSEQEEMRFHFSMMDVKMAIEYHGLHCILDALFSDNTYKNDLEKYLTKQASPATIVSVE
jgi:uncharacterized membrane protein YpjA